MKKLIFSGKIYNLFKYSLVAKDYYKKLVSQHIIKIIENKPQVYDKCQQKFQKLIRQQINNSNLKQQASNFENNKNSSLITLNDEQFVKIKLNMIFRVYSLPNVLQKYKQQLCEMIFLNKIRNQSQLDKITNLLLKKIKTNSQYSLKDIQQLKKQQTNDREQFQLFIKELKNKNQMIQINQVSKILREKFINIQSKQIYDRLKEINNKNLHINNKNKQNSNQTHEKQKNVKQFWDKLQNIKPRLLKQQLNDPQTYKKHLQITQNKLRFRFPPQPNGYLHIGHVKSMRINFQTAKRYNGICYLRYDDTNPQTQSHQYIQNILKNVRWLGYQPDKITYASDYFQQMLQFAIQLIKQGHAYVCDSPQIQIQKQRKQKQPNKYLNRQIQQSLKYFPNLKQGQTLRLKLDYNAKNPTLRDPIIYRIKQHTHPRTGNKYRIYPIYDFAHCICDSLEHIDYSLCSLEFQVRRQLYYKILDLLKLYKPIVWQYSRLNVQGSVISKRKIKGLIQSHAIDNWSDPRLLTIGGLINRGYTPNMLINFIDKINASRAGNQNIIQFSLLERQMRKQLFKISEKSMMALNPISVQIQGVQENYSQKINVQLYTDPEKKQKREIILSKNIYVQRQENLYVVGKIIVLKYFGPYQITQVTQNLLKTKKINQTIKQLKEQSKQFKIIHWISQKDSQKYETNTFDKLLDQHDQPNKQSKKVYKNSLIPKDVYQNRNNMEKYWQMERLGYFKFDKDGNFIRCVTLNQK